MRMLVTAGVIFAFLSPTALSDRTNHIYTETKVRSDENRVITPNVNVTILRRSLCEQPDDNTGLLYLLMHLRLMNTTKRKLAVRTMESEASFFTISKSVDDALKGRYEATIGNESIPAKENLTEPMNKSHSKNYRVLRPHDTSDIVVRVEMIVSVAGTVRGAIPRGPHYLQVAIPVWVSSTRLKKGKKTLSKGYSKAFNVLSDPVLFSVNSNDSLEDCSCKDRGINELQALGVPRAELDQTKYQVVASDNKCEWTVIAYPRVGYAGLPSYEYIINKINGQQLFKVRSQ